MIHPTAVVDRKAVLAPDVEIGPYAVIGPEVELGAGVSVGAHSVIEGRTRVGARTRISASVVLGGDPQIVGHGRGGALEIGCDNVIREFCAFHTGSERGSLLTRIGDGNTFLNHVHVAHDCRVGSHCVFASYAALGGHVVVEDYAVLGAMTGVHQFARIGESAFTAANAMLSQDVPPFAKVAGDRARFAGLNRIGLERRGIAPEAQRALQHAYHLIWHSKLRLAPALAKVREECAGVAEVDRLIAFLEASERGFTR
jgi:UDP-N-acetylglucosamine acyltransferase